MVAACGGEDGDGGTAPAAATGGSLGGGVMCFAYLLVSGDDQCLTSAVSSGSSSGASSGSSSGSSGSPGPAIRYVLNYEYEPNDDWLTANPLVMESSPSPDGFIADGSVNDASDRSDTFSFTRRIGRGFRIRLCADGNRDCNEYGEVDTLTAYVDVLDATGNVLASSQAEARNLVEMRLQSGSTYYVRVVAGDTMSVTVAYHLTGHEFE